MKRTLLSTLFLLFVLVASAQFDIGIKAGYNSSLTLNNLRNIRDGSYSLNNVRSEMWNNFQAGIFARIMIDKFYIQPELLYSMQRKEYDMIDVLIDGTAKNVDTYMNISNVEVPLLLGYKALDLKMANIRVFAGPKFILNAGSSLEYKNITQSEVKSSNLLDEFKKAQMDLVIGAGVDVFKFALDARLNLMQDVWGRIGSKDNSTTLQPPTSSFVISLGWKFL